MYKRKGRQRERKPSFCLNMYIYVYKNKGVGDGQNTRSKAVFTAVLDGRMDVRSVLDYMCISGMVCASGTIRFSPLPCRSGLLYPFLPRSRLKV